VATAHFEIQDTARRRSIKLEIRGDRLSRRKSKAN